MDLYLRDGDDPLGFIQFDNSDVKTSDELKQFRVEASLECTKCGMSAKWPPIDWATQSNQLKITLEDEVFNHPCVSS